MKPFHLVLHVSKLFTLNMNLLWFCVLMPIDCKKMSVSHLLSTCHGLKQLYLSNSERNIYSQCTETHQTAFPPFCLIKKEGLTLTS